MRVVLAGQAASSIVWQGCMLKQESANGCRVAQGDARADDPILLEATLVSLQGLQGTPEYQAALEAIVAVLRSLQHQLAKTYDKRSAWHALVVLQRPACCWIATTLTILLCSQLSSLPGRSSADNVALSPAALYCSMRMSQQSQNVLQGGHPDHPPGPGAPGSRRPEGAGSLEADPHAEDTAAVSPIRYVHRTNVLPVLGQEPLFQCTSYTEAPACAAAEAPSVTWSYMAAAVLTFVILAVSIYAAVRLFLHSHVQLSPQLVGCMCTVGYSS